MSGDVFAVQNNLKNFHFGWISRLDPRTRILATGLFALVVVVLHRFEALLAALVLVVAVAIISDMPLVKTMRRVLTMDGFILFMLLSLPFTTPGEKIFVLFGFPASWQGLELACKIALRANAIVLMMLLLLGSLEPTTLGHGLFRLKAPEKLVQLLLFTVRYIEVIHQEYQRLRISMKARCFCPQNSVHTYRSFGYLIGMMLVRAMERSERIHQAMKCRGFSGRFVILDDLYYSRWDAVFVIMFSIGLTLLFWLEYGYATAF